MNRAFSFVEQLLRSATQYDCTCALMWQTGELNHSIFADHDLLDSRTAAKLDQFGMIERRHDLTTCHQRQSLYAIEISMFNRYISTECNYVTINQNKKTE